MTAEATLEFPEEGAPVAVRDEYGTVHIGTFTGIQPGKPMGNSRRDRTDKWIVVDGDCVSHVPEDSIRQWASLPV